MSILRTFVLISVLSVSFLSSCATDEIILSTPDIDSVQVELLGSYQVQELGASGAGLHYIAVDSSGNYAYVTNSLKGLIVLDISDPANPDSIGVYADMGEINMVLTSQEYAYAVDFPAL